MSFKSFAVRFAESCAKNKPCHTQFGEYSNGEKYVQVYFNNMSGCFYDIGESYAYLMLTNGVELSLSDDNAGYRVDVRQPYDQDNITSEWFNYVVKLLKDGEVKTPEEKELVNNIYKGLKEELNDFLDSYKNGYVGNIEEAKFGLDEILNNMLAIDREKFNVYRKKCWHENHYTRLNQKINDKMYGTYLSVLETTLKDFLFENGKLLKNAKGKDVWQLTESNAVIAENLKEKIEEIDAIRRLEIYLTDQAEEEQLSQRG